VDIDADGVPDTRDACPRTPTGAIVDRRGCPADSDGDGHLDGLDRCPNTPPGVVTEASGCPVDSDRDGVYDGADQCPNSPPGSAVDARGCPLDADGDGVSDADDRCPGTPPHATVNASGCPVSSDEDGDGVDDARDRCPGTSAGTPVDTLGCQVLFAREREALVLQGVNFESGNARLLPTSHTVLDQVGASLLAHPEVRIEIAGYTDNTGSARTNTRLSAERARAVQAYLQQRGVAAERMRAAGFGPADPVASNATPAGRARNRRVELRQVP
jgi:OmpA-OmpF porin, OOP family